MTARIAHNIGGVIISHDAYLRTAGFRRRREAFIMLAGNRCERCGRGNCNLTIHHLHYDTIGHESPDDVLVLCPKCHWHEHPEKRHLMLDRAWFNKAECDDL